MSLGHGPKIVRDGLVLHLDAANPKSYPGTGTTWNDLSGNSNHASLVGNASYLTYNSSGYFQHSPNDVYFGAPDGVTGAPTDQGGYWNISSSPELSPDGGWTVSGISDVQGSQSGNGCGWFVMDDLDSKVHLEPISNSFRANGLSGWSHLNPNISAYHNNFAHYTFTFSQTSGVYGTDAGLLTCYINGALVATQPAFIPTLTTDYQISLGRRRGHLQHFFKGRTALYNYYTRPLSLVEVQQNFNATKGRFGL